MAETLKELIDKIQTEGIKAALEKAKGIEEEAKRHAEAIIEKATKEAKAIVEKAREDIRKMEEGGKAALKQAGRDLLLTLRGEITALLERLTVAEVRKALTGDDLVKIIAALIKDAAGKEEGKVIISLNKEDIANLEKGFLGKLSNEVKKGIDLKPTEEIQGGFLISFDSGKSYFDFTDKALAEYLAMHLKPALANFLKDAAKDSIKGKGK